MTLKKLSVWAGLCLLTTSFLATAENDISATYKNQRGSTMVLIWHKDFQNTGTLTGTFTTAVGNCKKDVGVALPLTGYFNKNVITIATNFPHCNQVVAKTGFVSKDLNSIHTIWLNAKHTFDSRGKNWDSNLIGTDDYTKISD